GEFRDAVALLQRAQRFHPGDFWVNHDLAYAFCSVRPAQYDKAIRYLTAGVALRPGSSGVHNSLGIALDNQGDYDGAIAAYREAIRLRPDYPEAHGNLGYLYYRRCLFGTSAHQFEEALRASPRLAEDLQAGHRYNAACAAALAGTSRGRDADD